MPLNTNGIRFAQGELKRTRNYKGPIDGAMNSAMAPAMAGIDGLRPSWTMQRKVVGFIQKTAGLKGSDIDGLWGDQTQTAFDSLLFQRQFNTPPPTWRPEDRVLGGANTWPSHANNDNAVIAFYGQPGENLAPLVPPYEHFLSWSPGTRARSILCNTKVHGSLTKVLNDVLDVYGAAEIKRLRLDQFGGCFNKRRMRGGTRWSTHSWGMALDYDPENNQLKWKSDRATFARPEYLPWWKCWEDEGWTSLGRVANFDWMHVQAAGV